ncbi:hypothetical protein D9M68_896040 [compost metagenome]
MLLKPRVQRPPGALQQQRIPRRQRHAAAQILALTLNRQHDQIAAFGDHARKKPCPYQRRARRDQHLGKARLAVEQRIGEIADQSIFANGKIQSPDQFGSLIGGAANNQNVAFPHSVVAGRLALCVLHRDKNKIG